MKTKQRVPQGVYKPCTGPGGCGGKGWKERTATGRKMPHARCGGDGWIKVRNKRGGRRPGGGHRPGAKRAAVSGSGLLGGAYAYGGATAVVLVAVVVALVAGIALYRQVKAAGW